MLSTQIAIMAIDITSYRWHVLYMRNIAVCGVNCQSHVRVTWPRNSSHVYNDYEMLDVIRIAQIQCSGKVRAPVKITMRVFVRGKIVAHVRMLFSITDNMWLMCELQSCTGMSPGSTIISSGHTGVFSRHRRVWIPGHMHCACVWLVPAVQVTILRLHINGLRRSMTQSNDWWLCILMITAGNCRYYPRGVVVCTKLHDTANIVVYPHRYVNIQNENIHNVVVKRKAMSRVLF